MRINLEEDVSSTLSTGLEQWHFRHEALPELDLNKIDTSRLFLNSLLAAPILISPMTGGVAEAESINRNLAVAAQQCRIAMGVGSQRAALQHSASIDSFTITRKKAPDVPLLANLGAVQLNYDHGLDSCLRSIDMIEANALVLHLNPLQEALQPEGNTSFGQLLQKIELLCTKISIPIIVKEVGWGISAQTAKRLSDAGVAIIDVAGAGGTSWALVEMHRADDDRRRKIAAAFADWGIPTAHALEEIHDLYPEIELIASGGLRNGIDIAKCIALGAQLGGMTTPFLRAATVSAEAIIQEIELLIDEIRICMFSSGCGSLLELDQSRLRKLHECSDCR